MARVHMVTRTMTNTHAVVLGMNLDNAEAEKREVTVARTYKTSDKLLKAVSEKTDDEHFKAVSIVSSDEVEIRMGMTEDEFIKYAHEIAPLNTGDEEETETEE